MFTVGNCVKIINYNNHLQDGPPSKKLHLVKKPLIGSSAAAFVGLLEKCKSSDEALQLLLRISDCLQFQESDVEEAIKKLSEHFQSEQESVVRVKILWLFCDIGLECPGANLNHLIDETIHLIKNETSHKVMFISVSRTCFITYSFPNVNLGFKRYQGIT